jgi:hypothetical protein
MSDSGGALGTTGGGGGGDVRPSGGSDNHAQHRGCGGQLVRAPAAALPLSDEGDVRAPAAALPLSDEGDGRSDHFDSPG